jgi:hypothetical protein
MNTGFNGTSASDIYTITLGPATSSSTITSTYPYDWNTLDTNNSLDVKGDANFEGDVKIQGKSLVDTLQSIEERLAILRPNPELEEKWERLKTLGNMYRELEKEILEKQEMWNILKK